jgi:uncharacterized protein YndB with AHSA1/START domain
MDVRPGGVWRHTMHGPDGTDYPNNSTFLEVIEAERIVYSHNGGRKGDPSAQSEVTWRFESQGNKTKLTLRLLFPSAAARDLVVKTYNAVEGGNQTLDRLGGTPGENASCCQGSGPRPRLRCAASSRLQGLDRCKAAAAPVGPEGIHQPRLRGGRARRRCMAYRHARPDGTEYPCGGVYREVVEPERVVFTIIARDKDGNPIIDGLTTVTFAEHAGKTTLTLQTRGVAVVPYAVAYLARMEAGWTQSLARLAEELARS